MNEVNYSKFLNKCNSKRGNWTQGIYEIVNKNK